MIAGFEEPTRGRDLRRRGAGAGGPPLPAARQHRLPVLRHLPPPQRLRQRRLRSAPSRGKGRGAATEGHRGLRDGAALGLREAQARHALGRPAAEGRAREGARQPPEGAAPGRAVGGPRPQAQERDAARAKEPAARGRDHLRLRHARPGRGAHDERPDRGDERGQGPAGRRPRHPLRATEEPLRRQLHRPDQRVLGDGRVRERGQGDAAHPRGGDASRPWRKGDAVEAGSEAHAAVRPEKVRLGADGDNVLPREDRSGRLPRGQHPVHRGARGR